MDGANEKRDEAIAEMANHYMAVIEAQLATLPDVAPVVRQALWLTIVWSALQRAVDAGFPIDELAQALATAGERFADP